MTWQVARHRRSVRRVADVRPLYCSVDEALYRPDEATVPTYALGYLGTYSADRQPTVDKLLLHPARLLPEDRFVVAGAQYPSQVTWPGNVEHREHCPPSAHRTFYNSQRYTLNVTRADMIANGWSPSVRLFEAAACGTPVISDAWAGLEDFLVPGEQILVAQETAEVVHYLHDVPESERMAIAEKARAHVLAHHTSLHRAAEVEQYVQSLRDRRVAQPTATTAAESATW